MFFVEHRPKTKTARNHRATRATPISSAPPPPGAGSGRFRRAAEPGNAVLRRKECAQIREPSSLLGVGAEALAPCARRRPFHGVLTFHGWRFSSCWPSVYLYCCHREHWGLKLDDDRPNDDNRAASISLEPKRRRLRRRYLVSNASFNGLLFRNENLVWPQK